MGTYDVSASHTVPVPAERTFDTVLPTPLERIFTQRHGPIPAIREVRDQTGDWSSAGQTRTILLADGGRMQEELTEVDRPGHFGYRLSDIHGPMRPLVAGVEGRWEFTPEGTGTRITWSWRLHPTAIGTIAMPVFGFFWRGYAMRGLRRIEDLLVQS